MSKRKLALLVIGSALFVAGSLWLWTVADTQQRHSPIVVKVVAVSGVLLFTICFVFGAIKLFDSTPGLIIDGEGLIDRSSFSAVGRIAWADIVDLNVIHVAGTPMLVIQVVDPLKYGSRNLFKRLLNWMNTKAHGGSIMIVSTALQVNFEELVDLVDAGLDFYRRTHSPGDAW